MEQELKRYKIGFIILTVIVLGIGVYWGYNYLKSKPILSCSNPQIKGNISTSGEKIFHVPGQKNYDSTIIETAKDERMFCTEKDAEAAGWRKSKI